MKISQILDKIDEKQLFIPAFQREYVWSRDNAKKLIGSLIREYPTGSMLLWETNTPPELKGGHQYDPRQGSVKIILDGQQRITTLYLLIRNKIPPYYKESEILKDPRGLYVDISKLRLEYYKDTIMSKNPYWINVTDILQRTVRERDIIRNIVDSGKTLSRNEEDKISDNFRAIESIPDKEFIEQHIPVKASLKEAIDIFYIVNASGVNLTEAELALAQISGYWPQARETFKKKLEELKNNGFIFKLDFIVYCLLGIIYSVGSDMTRLHDPLNCQNIKDTWLKLESHVLDYVVNLLRSKAFIDHSDEINSIYALVPIIVFVYKKEKNSLTDQEIKKIIKWLYYTQIRQRYVSQLPQKLDKDISIVTRSTNPFDELLQIIKLERPLEISPDEFEGVDIRNALFSLMRWYFKSKNAICFTTGIGIRQNMGKKYSLEWDHIFPYSILKEAGYNLNNRYKYALAQEITNRVILTQIANRRKSNKLPEEYLKDVSVRFPTALALQVIPANQELWKIDNYEAFLKTRRIMLANELNNFLTNITVTEQSYEEVPIEEIIVEGESSEMEFKSSLRWNYKEQKVDKALEQVIMKSVAGFNNCEGGMILIGVDDQGEALGLDNDYRELNGTKDEFELHLRNLLNSSFGNVFSIRHVEVTFPEINSRQICKIVVKKGVQPKYIEATDKMGQKTKKFYVRSGNSTIELKIDEVADYINMRFNNDLKKTGESS
ncbi:MAG: DUF262 domain-containing protein [Candidatus Roizmanbacteria bacterium]